MIVRNINQENLLEKELLALVEYANEVADKNPVGFMIYFIKTKKSIYDNGGNPSIFLKSSEKEHKGKLTPLTVWY